MEKLRALFGGTFDPPHLGHFQILKTLAEDPLVASVHLVLARRNPLRAADHFGSDAERLRWRDLWLGEMKLALSTEDFQKIRVEDFEIESQSQSTAPSYTIDTLEHLKAVYRGDWVLVGGADLIQDLPKWHRAHELLQRIHSFWVFPRKDVEVAAALAGLTKDLSGLAHFRIMGVMVPAVSSTEIRHLLTSSNASQGALENCLIGSIARDLVQMQASR